MKKSSVFYAILFLAISPIAILAAEINLNESSKGTIAVEIDTKGEVVNSVKVAIKVSDNVTVGDIKEGDYSCSSFSHTLSSMEASTLSSTQKDSVIEITCTTQEESPINASIANINFTTTSADYSFTVLADESQIGNLSIGSTKDIEGSQQEETGDETPQVAETTTPTQKSTPTTDTGKEKKITNFLPYILLGVAGVLLLSIIILLVTKEKGNTAKTEQTETSVATTEPVTTAPSEEITTEEKPTLQDMVNAGISTTATETEPTTPPVGNHQKDLEALIMSEDPRTSTSPTETPIAESVPTSETPTTPQEVITTDTFTTPMETPIAEPVTTPTFEEPVAPQENVATDTFTTPIEVPVAELTPPPTLDTPTTQQENVTADTFTTPMETPIAEPVTTPTFEEPTTPQENVATDTFTTPMETPITEPVTTPTFETPVAPQETVADTSEDLPHIGFTAPTEPTTTTPTDSYSHLYATPTEQTPTQAEIEVPQQQEAMDLQALVNNEINNIPTGGDTTQPPTPIEPETTTEQPQI